MAIGINIDNFPRIIIKFPETFVEDDLDKFFNYILGLMDNENKYEFIIYIDSIKNPPFKFKNKIIQFSKDINKKPNYIQYSVIICNSTIVKNFIRLILNMERPKSLTYLIDKKNIETELISIYNGNPLDKILKFKPKQKTSKQENKTLKQEN